MEKQLILFSAPPTKETKASPLKPQEMHIYVDGASRGNPGPAGAGIYFTYGNKVIAKKGIFLGKKTNNQAEYLALALALFFAEKICVEKDIVCSCFHVFSDSELLVKQYKGLYKIKNPELAQLKKVITALLKNKQIIITHVRREKNKEADALANEGIDKKNKIPLAFSKILSENGLSI